MEMETTRIEKDSLGEVRVPKEALYGAQTQRAADNFKISRLRFPGAFLSALALIKECCAMVNGRLGELDSEIAEAIRSAAARVRDEDHHSHFPVDVMQTGSGTSVNMNMNEVIATLARRQTGREVHPNDHVNRSQSSNDVIPTTIHVSCRLKIETRLMPALSHLASTLDEKAVKVDSVVKMGRTHLMDALPIRMDQELRAWRSQIVQCEQRIQAVLPRLGELPIGGTAIGTGVNAPPGFGAGVVRGIARETSLPFAESSDRIAAISSPDTAIELSGSLRVAAVVLMKISNDLRWMNSGPRAGLGEISLRALQPGSSIMPGKVNPVIPEAVVMACAKVQGNDAAIAVAAQSGSFQLNTMLPLIAYSLLESIELLANSAEHLADLAVGDFSIHRENLDESVRRNPILATVLAPKIGYDRVAEIVREAEANNESIVEAAIRKTNLPREEVEDALDPVKLTAP